MSVSPRFFFRELKQSLKRNLMLNLSSIYSVMILIFILGFFYLVIENIDNVADIAKSKLQITVVLSPTLSLDKTGTLKYRIMKHPEVAEARYISKEKAYNRLRVRLKYKIDRDTITRNPLPNTLELKLYHPDKIKSVAEEIKNFQGVDGVKYGNTDLIDKLIRFSNRIRTTGIVIMIFLLISAIFLISNTIKLTVFSRRKEIEIMELVGASQWFIRGPFIAEGFLHGFVGSALSIIALNLIYFLGAGWIQKDLSIFPILSPIEVAPAMSGILLGVGIAVGVISSYISVNRYLRI